MEMLVIIRGQNILRLRKFDYTKHPMAKDLIPVSIQNYCPEICYPVQAESVNEPAVPAKQENKKKKFAYGNAKAEPISSPPDEF